MKRSKRMLALVAVLGVVCVAALILTQYQETQEEIKSSGTAVLELPADTVESLSWEYSSGDGFAFHREGDGWSYDADGAFPVSGEKIGEILSCFESFRASFVIENAEDYSQYGLDSPTCTICLDTAEQSFRIRLGEFSRMDEQRYIDIGDGNVYLAASDPMDCLETALSGLIRHDSTPVFGQVSDIAFRGTESYTILRDEDSNSTYCQEDIYFAQINGEELPLDTDAVTDYLNTITSLDLLHYVTYNATGEELASCGLDEPELSVTVNYTYTDEDGSEASDVCVLHIGQNPEELEAYEAAREAGEDELPDVTRYVRVGDSQIIYELNDTDYVTLSGAAYNDLRHTEVFWADFDTVAQLDITLEGETHSITSAPDEDDADSRLWYYGEQELDISNLQRALSALSAERFTGEAPTGKEEIGLTIHLENESFPQVEIQLYRYDGSLCLAVVDGQTISLVDRGAVMDLVEAVQAIVLN